MVLCTLISVRRNIKLSDLFYIYTLKTVSNIFWGQWENSFGYIGPSISIDNIILYYCIISYIYCIRVNGNGNSVQFSSVDIHIILYFR